MTLSMYSTDQLGFLISHEEKILLINSNIVSKKKEKVIAFKSNISKCNESGSSSCKEDIVLLKW